MVCLKVARRSDCHLVYRSALVLKPCGGLRAGLGDAHKRRRCLATRSYTHLFPHYTDKNPFYATHVFLTASQSFDNDVCSREASSLLTEMMTGNLEFSFIDMSARLFSDARAKTIGFNEIPSIDDEEIQ